MALNDFDGEIKDSLEYSCKQWCGNHSVKYNPDNVMCPVSEEEHAGVVSSKSEGMVFSFDYNGKKVYGYYKATAKAEPANSLTASVNSTEYAKAVDNSSKTSRVQLPMVGKSGFSDAFRELKYVYNNLYEIKNEIDFAISSVQNLEKQLEVLDGNEQMYIAKSNSKRKDSKIKVLKKSTRTYKRNVRKNEETSNR